MDDDNLDPAIEAARDKIDAAIREFMMHECQECGKTWSSSNAADACCSTEYDRGRE